jgi:putative transposase
LWVTDLTYVPTWSGVAYVCFIVDAFSRMIVGWKAARTMHTSLVLDALNMAAWTRRGVDIDGVICHSDAGSQYTSIAYTDRLDDIGAAPSIGTVGDSFDCEHHPRACSGRRRHSRAPVARGLTLVTTDLWS